MKVIKSSFYHRETGRVIKGTAATKKHEDVLKAAGMDVSAYVGEEKAKKSAKKDD